VTSRRSTPPHGAAREEDSPRAANRQHWDRTLDPQNLSQDRTEFDYETELLHWDSTEQRWALSRMRPLGGRMVLELGGGLGVGAVALARGGAYVALLDISVERAKAARRAIRRAGLEDRIFVVVGAAENLPFREGAFDYVTTKSVLIHTDLPRAAAEIHRALRPGGRAVALEPLDSHPGLLVYRRFFAPPEWKRITRYWNPREAREFLRAFRPPGENADGEGALEEKTGGARLRFFYFFGFLSAFFTYGRFRCRPLRRLFETLCDPLDAALLRFFPFFRWKCWFCGLEATRRAPLSSATSPSAGENES